MAYTMEGEALTQIFEQLTNVAPQPRRYRRWLIALLGVVVLIGGLFTFNAVSNHAIDAAACTVTSIDTDLCPAWCWHPYPVTVAKATPAQAAVVRCYLEALADKSRGEMKAVLPASDWAQGGDDVVTAKSFRFATDLRNGTPTVSVRDIHFDSANSFVEIRFADGVHTEQFISLVNPTSAKGWRIN
jgi:hypothetical protein